MDNARDIKRAISDLSNYKWVECFAHTLYLSLGKAVNIVRVKNTVTICRKMVNYFSKSNNLTRKFLFWVYVRIFTKYLNIRIFRIKSANYIQLLFNIRSNL